jgi:AcrR family transcriptional regulator
VAGALEIFLEFGFDATTVTEIERRAGLSPGSGSFYRHFASKEELLKAAVEREIDICTQYVAEVETQQIQESDPREALKLQLERVLGYIRQYHRLVRLNQRDGSRLPDVRETIEAAVRRSGGLDAWADDPYSVVITAALLAYEFMEVPGIPTSDVEEKAFLDALSDMAYGAGLRFVPASAAGGRSAPTKQGAPRPHTPRISTAVQAKARSKRA